VARTSGVERFLERTSELGLEVEVREFPAGTRTAADAAAAIGCEVGQIVKSLVFVADDRPVLVLTSGANHVDEARLAGHLGTSSVRKADADEVRAATGYAIGGTPPFAHDTDLAVCCDRDLTAYPQVWAAAGSPTTVFPIAPEVLLRATDAHVLDVS
jgi:prolyl-tRNA editing enzyme YbaK/EbsC (Cys-tRNA(Pro) deacylase)